MTHSPEEVEALLASWISMLATSCSFNNSSSMSAPSGAMAETVATFSDQIISGSPGSLFNAGWSAAVKALRENSRAASLLQDIQKGLEERADG